MLKFLTPLILTCHLAAVEVVVHPEIVNRNGRQEVPTGLFGTHAVPVDAERIADWGLGSIRTITHVPRGPRTLGEQHAGLDAIVDCLFDRFQPARQVANPTGWEEELEALGRRYGEQTRDSGQSHFIEFWNEPYLNWSTRPAVNFQERYYKNDAITPGAPMILRGTDEPVPGLEWHRQMWIATQPGTGIPEWFLTSRIPANAEPGQTVRLHAGAGEAAIEEGATIRVYGREVQLRRGWVGRDVEQRHYWAGPVNVRWYIDMYRTFAAALKEADPEVNVAGGWGFNIWNEGWDSWHHLYRPLIDETHPYLDAIHEHHYGGDTRMVPLSYEMTYAYALGTHGRRLDFWNTEAGGHLDPEQPGNALPHNAESGSARAMGAFTYLVRDIAYILRSSPDKGIFRAAHHSHHTAGGDPAAFRLMKPLRGDLLSTTSSDAEVWAVASRRDDGRMALLLFNDSSDQHTLRLQLPLTEALSATRVATTAESLELVREDLDSNDDGSWSIPLGSKQAVLLLSHGALAVPPVAHWQQHVTAEILTPVGNDSRWQIQIADDAYTAAQLRLTNAGPIASLRLAINDHELELANLPTGINDVSIPHDWLQADNHIRILDHDAESAGILIPSISLWTRAP